MVLWANLVSLSVRVVLLALLCLFVVVVVFSVLGLSSFVS